MDFFDVVKARYSHKEKFLKKIIPPYEDLEKIALAGILAPNGANRQVVRLVILDDAKALDELRDVVSTSGFDTAPAAIAVLTDGKSTPAGAVNFEKEDYSAAITQILLAATALGYSALWLDSPYWDKAIQKMAVASLGAPEHYHLWAVVPIGKPDGAGSRRVKIPVRERIFRNRINF